MPAKLNPKKETKTLWPPKFLVVLAMVFLTIWIIIGVFFLLVIYSQIKQGAFSGLFAKPQSPQTTTQSQAPKEGDLPGVGKVNIDCVRNALSEESIGKIIEAGNASSLSSEDKEKLDKCVVEKAPESPQPSPTG
ncbi:hypothetical protein A3D81_00670 [Candidatus Curtissbacteria bacterium RIFCSPHIGHO2_02_FULL_40_17]|uniref:Uncharacterized protein n=2 Tax=Candidatus Curtissiibacteriota TaxID=1752717 RepID=A0A1F5GJM3_9BACT|nr:MAG: hypothetical protein A2693_00960 [Candidatus Curtissbacteria bacterium RIFCSPHIGHO2_01_FULL_40_12]OGD92096.1 MAG: hypothetical protein A3D81_00670 [Candidatus Curtissbacteria bacterium RIFCSPHIGHO2_02_FULL_40_17]